MVIGNVQPLVGKAVFVRNVGPDDHDAVLFIEVQMFQVPVYAFLIQVGGWFV
jgi:hypothetical protein